MRLLPTLVKLLRMARPYCSGAVGGNEKRGFVPRRALIYVPASSEKMLAKVQKLQSNTKADCVVLELEDGVALQAKDVARQNAVKYLEQCRFARLECMELGLRVNSVDSGLLADDLKAISTAKRMPQAFMVPKVDSVSILTEIYRQFKDNFGGERVQQLAFEKDVRWVAWIESSRALIALPEMLLAAENLHKSGQFFKLDAIVFGSDDYCADIGALGLGASRSKSCEECLYARQKCVSVASAFGIQAIDAVYIDIEDRKGLKKQCVQGAAWGFTGKQVIHPSQIEIVQDAFAPSPQRCNWALELVQAYEQSTSEMGKGAFTFRGQMVDRPLLLQAKNVVQMMERLGWKV